MECQIKEDVKFRCDAPRPQILMEPFETHIIRLLCILLETETKLEQREEQHNLSFEKKQVQNLVDFCY